MMAGLLIQESCLPRDSHGPHGNFAAARPFQLRSAVESELGHRKAGRHRLPGGGSAAEWKSPHRGWRVRVRLSAMPYMMMPGDDKVVAPRVRELLTKSAAHSEAGVILGAAAAGGRRNGTSRSFIHAIGRRIRSFSSRTAASCRAAIVASFSTRTSRERWTAPRLQFATARIATKEPVSGIRSKAWSTGTRSAAAGSIQGSTGRLPYGAPPFSCLIRSSLSAWSSRAHGRADRHSSRAGYRQRLLDHRASLDRN